MYAGHLAATRGGGAPSLGRRGGSGDCQNFPGDKVRVRHVPRWYSHGNAIHHACHVLCIQLFGFSETWLSSRRLSHRRLFLQSAGVVAFFEVSGASAVRCSWSALKAVQHPAPASRSPPPWQAGAPRHTNIRHSMRRQPLYRCDRTLTFPLLDVLGPLSYPESVWAACRTIQKISPAADGYVPSACWRNARGI